MLKVRDIMTRDVKACRPDDTLDDASRIMWEHDCGSVPVIDVDSRVVGIITDRDICMAVATKHRPAGEIAVGEVISGRLHACRPDDDVQLAMEVMRSNQVRRVVVVDGEGRIQGVLALYDLLVRGLVPSETRRSKLSGTDVLEVIRTICDSSATEAAAPRPARRARSAATPPARAASGAYAKGR